MEKYLSRREELGLDISAGCSVRGRPGRPEDPEEAVVEHLRFARDPAEHRGERGILPGVLAARYGSARGVGQKEEKEATL